VFKAFAKWSPKYCILPFTASVTLKAESSDIELLYLLARISQWTTVGLVIPSIAAVDALNPYQTNSPLCQSCALNNW